LLVQKKVTKEKDTRFLAPSGFPVRLGISGAPATGGPSPAREAPRPCGAPLGLIRKSLRCSAASTGRGALFSFRWKLKKTEEFWGVTLNPLRPRRASQSEAGIARRGPTRMSVLPIRGRDAPYGQPRWRREAQSSQRPGPRGVLLFGYFLLDKQEKVPRSQNKVSRKAYRSKSAAKLITGIRKTTRPRS
jgi:hypothetical protein